jgi:glycosyltransferase involved in cell wall biosynthesis
MSQKILFCTSVFREDENSAGRQMIDLVREFESHGFSCQVVTNIGEPIADLPNTEVRSLGLRLRGAAMPLRLLYEIVTPFALFLKYVASRRSEYAAAVSFSPSIFWYFYLKCIGRRIRGKKILILRDIFPIWLADVGVLSSTGVVFRVLNYFCRKQLETYNVIFVQNESDVELLQKNYQLDCEVSVLRNWYSPSPKLAVADEIIEFCSHGGFTLAVVGTFGLAQDLERSCSLLNTLLQEFMDVKILFVGLGNEARSHLAGRLKFYIGRVRFENRMSHDELINTLRYVDAGYFSLDEKNEQGHFPGKVLAYITAGRPVFGSTGVNAPISKLLEREDAGMVTNSRDQKEILRDFKVFKSRNWSHRKIKSYARDLYSSENAFEKLAGYIRNE